MRPLTAVLVLALPWPALYGQTTSRIVSTSPSITETLYALGLGGRVVGVTSFCTYPPEAKSKPKVGTFLEPDYERILALKPDLVLVIRNPINVSGRLSDLGLRTADLDMDTVESVFASIAAIGRLTGTGSRAAALSASLKRDLDAVRAAGSKSGRTSVLFLVGRAPGTLQSMVGAGPGTFLDQLLRLAGGTNILAQSPIQYPKVSLETILASDPDVIIDMGDYAHGSGANEARRREELALWKAYGQLKAVRTGRVHAVTAAHFVVPGPRMNAAARDFLAFLHPEAARGGAR
ncbi:MAG TPA: helical backbone metal receptor [Bryobacteraceae bacterium]|nr:helical backbone metal receptor [Bryobacteraceae bacterium]HPT29311.1 helical backbone metal receptor [Bryobacteraceae bacterium]